MAKNKVILGASVWQCCFLKSSLYDRNKDAF